jgi:hypothetical protein
VVPLAGFVPLLEAEQRLAVSRRALGGIEGLITALHREAETEAAEDLDLIRADPVAAVYAYEAEEALGEQVLAVRDELPLMLFGVLIAYQLSLLESCLAGCVETADCGPRRTTPDKGGQSEAREPRQGTEVFGRGR